MDLARTSGKNSNFGAIKTMKNFEKLHPNSNIAATGPIILDGVSTPDEHAIPALRLGRGRTGNLRDQFLGKIANNYALQLELQYGSYYCCS